MRGYPNRRLTLATALATGLTAASAWGAGPPRSGVHPNLDLPAVTAGGAAVTVLGERLGEVAEAHGMSAERLRQLLLRERTLHLDRRGRLFYQDDRLPAAPGGGATAGPSGAEAATYPFEQTFLLHSRPSATKLIYLDFDGHVLSGTAWNASFNGGQTITCPPFDFEGGPGVFTDNEKARIQHIWKRVAEDFAPFEVDVTTEDPGGAALTRSSTADSSYGIRVLINPISSYIGPYGGMAYVGVFDYVGDYYKPALIFPENLYSDEKYVSDACSHEAGHILNLKHDGTTNGTEYYEGHGSGTTGWAPIMGSAYYQPLTQWSRGEYDDASNTEDDLAIIASYTGYREDDRGSDTQTPTPLPAGSLLSTSGIIGRATDADVFSFQTGSGLATLQVSPAMPGANLDVEAELLNSWGEVVAAGNPVEALDAGLTAWLSPGTYYLRLTGCGCRTPSTGYSNYASLGQYTIEGTVPDPTGNDPPVAAATATPTAGDAPLTVAFNGAASYDPEGTLLQYSWSFGDGGASAAPSTSHVYDVGGRSYTATLTVTDGTGLQGAASVTVTVNDPDADTTPPTVPSGLTAAAASCSQIALAWEPSTDDQSGLAGYNLYRDEVLLEHLQAPASETTDTGLLESTTFSYALSAVDNAGNESARSAAASASTPACPDTVPPSPDPMTWASLPSASSQTSVTMTAATASDPSGVEYYFDCTDSGGHDSGWRSSRSYTDTGLSPGRTYTYRVAGRDRSPAQNQTAWSAAASATTPVSATKLHVDSIALSTVKVGRSYSGRATVTVRDNLGKSVGGAKVTGTFTGGYNQTVTASTNTAGQAVLNTASKSGVRSFSFCVTNVVHSLGYDPAANNVTCANR
ncbi:MAG: PKD domain-containing protein [Deltaproteobacteria bacterium]|nr:PKD domain-containing protein [Deltaproteobacteria bacterium]